MTPVPDVPPAGEGTAPTRWSFLTHEHSYLSEAIRFADQKAAFLFAAATACLGVMYQLRTYAHLSDAPLAWLLSNPLPAAATLALVLGAALGLWTLVPRLRVGGGDGIVFWKDVVRRRSAEAFHQEVTHSNAEALERALAVHCYTLARICDAKYSRVEAATWATAVGALMMLIVAALTA